MAQHLAKQNSGYSIRKSKHFSLPKFGKHSFTEFLSGRAPLKTQKIAIWAVFLELVLVSIIAQLLYPGGFSVVRETISHQGSIELNPIGSIIWRGGVIINGFAHIPHILFIGRRLGGINPKRSKVFQFFGIISGLGFVLVGILSMDFGAIHYIVALVAFIGYYITANIAYNILKKGVYLGKSQLVQSKIYKFFRIYFNISGAATLGSFIINGIFFNKDVSPIIEWNYLLAICAWLIAWPLILNKINEGKYLQLVKNNLVSA